MWYKPPMSRPSSYTIIVFRVASFINRNWIKIQPSLQTSLQKSSSHAKYIYYLPRLGSAAIESTYISFQHSRHPGLLPSNFLPNQSAQILRLHIPQIEYFLNQIRAWMEETQAKLIWGLGTIAIPDSSRGEIAERIQWRIWSASAACSGRLRCRCSQAWYQPPPITNWLRSLLVKDKERR